MRIAYEHADGLITYPQGNNLSAYQQPIRVATTYPRTCRLGGRTIQHSVEASVRCTRGLILEVGDKPTATSQARGQT